MKRVYFYRVFGLLAATLLVSGVLAQGTYRNQRIFVVPAPGPVTIDGDLKDWDLSGEIDPTPNHHIAQTFVIPTVFAQQSKTSSGMAGLAAPSLAPRRRGHLQHRAGRQFLATCSHQQRWTHRPGALLRQRHALKVSPNGPE